MIKFKSPKLVQYPKPLFTIFTLLMVVGLGSLCFPSLSSLSAQSLESEYPQFRSPIDYPLSLSGTFGELRRSGFHFGMDLRSEWRGDNDLIRSIGPGYVSRILVSASGYGNAVYINHPNGYTSVYAHLKEFSPKIKELVRSRQYAEKSFEVNFFPERHQLPVEVGQFIGFMGNTGHSFGRHLHFEIRKTDGQIPINPLLFGYEVADHHAPLLREIGVHLLDDKGNILEKENHRLRHVGKNNYRLSQSTLKIPAWQFGITLKGHDRMTGTNNRNGIYRIEMYVDDSLFHEITFDRLAYSERPYFKTHVDYGVNILDKKQHHLLYKHQGNRLQVYCDCPSYGIIPAFENKNQEIKIIASDFQGNQSSVEFSVVRKPPPYEYNTPVYTHEFSPDEAQVVSLQGATIKFPKNAFFKEERLHIKEERGQCENCISPVIVIREDGIPFYHAPTLYFETYSFPSHLKDKVFAAQIDEDGELTLIRGNWEGNSYKAKIRSIGSYALAIDTVPPLIKPKRFQRDARELKSISFEISDDLNASVKNGGLNYQTYINGQWALFEFDLKSNTIIHHFDRPLKEGTHQLRIEVEDAVGNQAVREFEFLR